MNPYLGEIRMFAGNFAPLGWALCNGTTLSIGDFQALFALIGTTYGGDGQSTFALPDLRSRIPAHQGGGLVLGSPGGAESVTLASNNLPSHTHTAQASAGGSVTTPSGNYWGGASEFKQFVEGTSANESLASGAIGTSGGGQAHDNMVPFLVLNFIIAMEGIFPSQN